MFEISSIRQHHFSEVMKARSKDEGLGIRCNVNDGKHG